TRVGGLVRGRDLVGRRRALAIADHARVRPGSRRAHAAKNTIPITAYRAISWKPSNQVDSPSDTSAVTIRPAASSAPTSYPLNTNAIGDGPTTNDRNTSSGITNSPICAAEPTAMLTARSILSLAAATTAT